MALDDIEKQFADLDGDDDIFADFGADLDGDAADDEPEDTTNKSIKNILQRKIKGEGGVEEIPKLSK